MEPGWAERRDLTQVLVFLAGQRKTAEAKHNLANHPVTLIFLKAGVSIFSDDPMHLGAVTKPRVLEKAEQIDCEDATSLKPNEAKFRDRWPFIDDYRADLLSYCLSWKHWSLHLKEDGDFHEQLNHAPGFYEAIQNVAFHDLETILRHEFSKIPFLMALSANHDPAVRNAVSATNQDLRALWGSLCTQVMIKRGLRLRPGITVEEVADLLIILSDGVALRVLSDSGNGVIDHNYYGSLLGKGAAALVAGFLDPGDGRSLRATLDWMGSGTHPGEDGVTPEG
jgi:hypothetical protein